MQILKLTVGVFQANCYLLISEKDMAVVDPGADADLILAEIKKSKAKCRYIINTHYHPDHIGANQKIKEETKALILIHKLESSLISFQPDRFLEQGDIIKIGQESLEVIHTPGHTPGSICLLGQDFILTGDTLFKDGYGRTDLIGGSFEKLKESLKIIADLSKKGFKIFPGHGEAFKV